MASGVLDAGKISTSGLREHVQSSLHHSIIDAGEFKRTGQSHLIAHRIDHDAGLAENGGHSGRVLHLDHEVIALGRLHRNTDVQISGQSTAPDAGGHQQGAALDAFTIGEFDGLEASALEMHLLDRRIGSQDAAIGFESLGQMSDQIVGSGDDAVMLDESADDIVAPAGVLTSKFVACPEFDVEAGLRQSLCFMVEMITALWCQGDVGEAGWFQSLGTFLDEWFESFAAEFRESIEYLTAHPEMSRSTRSSKGQ